MPNEIFPIPPVPPQIRDAINGGTLAVFIGAGVSRLIGCCGWGELAKNLVDRCHNEKIINFKEWETLSQIQDHRKIITICHHLFSNKNLANVFDDEMRKALKEGERIKIPNVYDDIYKLRGLFITTNADTHFDRLFHESNVYFRGVDGWKATPNTTKLYHIHGSIKDRDSLVFTVSEYMKRYNLLSFKEFLKNIFDRYTVLFLGYGLAEFEILSFILPGQKKELKHFMLSPFYSGEDSILGYEQSYCNDLGINVLAYEKDKIGYKQLVEVIRCWNKEINQVTDYQYNAFRRIDEAVERASMDKITETLQLIKNDKSSEDYFFKKLAISSKSLDWLVSLKDANYFAPANNPRPQEVPGKKGYFTVQHWNVLDALENMAIKNAEPPDEEVTKILLEIINGIIAYRDEKGERIDNYGTDWMILKTISRLPVKFISNEHIEFIKEALHPKIGSSLFGSAIGELFLPKLIREGAGGLILRLLGEVLKCRKSEREYISVLDQYCLERILDSNKAGISTVCGFEAFKVALAKIKEILSEDESRFNVVGVPAIENHEQTNSERYECQLLYFARDMLELANPTEIKTYVQQLLNEGHPIFKRLALHLINHHYNALADIFWSSSGNPLDILATHEIYELLKAHYANFTGEQIKTVLNWIETQRFSHSDDLSRDFDEGQKVQAYYKKEWLSALLETEHEEVIRRYKTYDEINPAEIEHPGFHHWVESGWVQDVSPIAEEEFNKKTNAQIAEYINAYKDESETGWSLTRVNLASALRRFVSNNPVKFSKDLTPFQDIHRKYQHELLMGLEEAWRNGKNFDWDELLPFVEKLIEDNGFWSEEKKDGEYDYNRWLIDAIANLIEEGTKSDRHAFAPELLPDAEKIILILLKNAKGGMSMLGDLMTSVLNSTRGKVFMAAISYSLRYARLYRHAKEERWADSIKSEFTERLDRVREPSLEFSVVLGWHLPFLNYLDKKWVASNIKKIFPIENNEHWEAAFTGYIVMTSMVHEEIYRLLRENGHYEKGLACSFKDEHAADKLIQQIVIGYLAGWDNLNDPVGLIRGLFRNVEHISELVSFLWSFRDKIDEKLKSKIKPLWKVVMENVKPNLDKEKYKVIASNLGRWLSLVDVIDDEVYEWLTCSARNIDEDNSAPFFIEYLLKHVKQTPEKVGKLYYEMLVANVYPTYNEEHIVAIIKILYEHSQNEVADKICNLYFSKGYEFLRITYGENRRRT